jgi:hypothetical protein
MKRAIILGAASLAMAMPAMSLLASAAKKAPSYELMNQPPANPKRGRKRRTKKGRKS